MPQAPFLLADIGGTNTRLALSDGAALRPDSIARFANEDFDGIVPIFAAYLREKGAAPARICAAAAGPIEGGVGRMTNLDWRIDPAEIAAAIGAEQVSVLNDLQAQGYALAGLGPDKLRCLKAGTAPQDPNATRLAIGIGTGLNSALVCAGPGGALVPPSESGHVTIPVQNAEELALRDDLEARLGQKPDLEDLISGRGLAQIADWTAREASQAPFADAHAVLAACSEGDAAARRAAALFARFLGRFAGDLALIQLPLGGIYLTGGMARAMTPWLAELGFAEAFADKGRFSGTMAQFAISVVEDDYAALAGCARHAHAI